MACCDHINENSSSTNCEEFVDELSDYRLLKKSWFIAFLIYLL